MAVKGLKVHVLDLLHHPGAQRKLHDSIPLAPMVVTSARVPEDADVSFDLTLEAHGVQIIATGNVEAPWVGECRRCLEPTTGVVHTSLREIFDRDPVPDETWPIAGDQIDLEPVIVESIVLELPLAPLCSEDCEGPAPDRFPTRIAPPEDAADADAVPPKDPRWAALDALRFED